MLELFGYEVRKMLHKPLVWVSLLSLLLCCGIMLFNWVMPGYNSVQEDVNGKKVILEGHAAVLRNQEIVRLYEGPLTTEKVRDIIETYSFSEAMMKDEHMDPDQQRYYRHNTLYDSFARSGGFVRPDGSYNGATVEEVYGALAPDLMIGYSCGWEDTIYVLAYIFLTWGSLLVVILSPVFSEEYIRGMDALILTGSEGRKKCPIAKIAASFAVSLGGSVILLGGFLLIMLAYHGPEGLHASIQLGHLGFLNAAPYVISWKNAFAFACLLWLGGIIVLTATILLVSAAAKSSFSALVISFALFSVPLFIPWKNFPFLLRLIGALFPINQMQLQSLFFLDKLTLGNYEMSAMWVALPVAVAAIIVGTLLPKRCFARHQVM